MSNKAKLTVNAGPVFIVEPTGQNILRDKVASFECVVESNPKPTVSWFYDEKELTIKDGVKIEKDILKNTYKLIIPKTNGKSVGVYRVKAFNEFGSETREVELQVQDLPKITNKLENKTVTENDEVRMFVEFTGKPIPKVIWYCDENEVVDVEMIESVDFKSILVLKPCKSSDSGVYQAKVYNDHGEVLSNKGALTINS